MDAEIFYVLVGSVIVAAIARWRGWPAPLLVTVVALAVSFIPAVPDIALDPDAITLSARVVGVYQPNEARRRSRRSFETRNDFQMEKASTGKRDGQ